MEIQSADQLNAAIRVVRTDKEVRARLFEYYRPYLLLVAERAIGAAVRRREDASDLVQQTIIDATAAADRFEGETEPAFSAWIHQILRRNIANAVRDHRAAKRDVRRETFVAENGSSATLSWQFPDIHQTTASQRMIRSEAALNLARGLEKLPDDQRRAVIMRHLDGRPLNEIAEVMNKTPAAVAGLIRRGVNGLREVIPGAIL